MESIIAPNIILRNDSANDQYDQGYWVNTVILCKDTSKSIIIITLWLLDGKFSLFL